MGSLNKIKVAPDVCAYPDDDHKKLTIEIALPGVKKENIKVRVHEDSLSLNAPREDIEYSTSLAFCCPIKPEALTAKYENGLLRIEAPFKDEESDTREIKID